MKVDGPVRWGVGIRLCEVREYCYYYFILFFEDGFPELFHQEAIALQRGL
jgi:hypothetical protein